MSYGRYITGRRCLVVGDYSHSKYAFRSAAWSGLASEAQIVLDNDAWAIEVRHGR